MTMLAIVVSVCLILWFTCKQISDKWRANPGSLPHPPGPPSKWIFGNLSEMPNPINFDVLLKWREDFGDLTYFHGFGKSILVLNSLKAATDLLEKRGIKYAHRPQLVVAGELMGLNEGVGMMDYGPKHRLYRKLAHYAFSPEAIQRYEPLLQKHTLLMLRDLLNDPADFFSAIRLTTVRNILSVSYGLDIPSVKSEYVVAAERTRKFIEEAVKPGVFVADFLPFMKYIPSWVPCASFKRFAEQGRRRIEDCMRLPFTFVKDEMARGIAPPSLVVDVLSEKNPALLKLEEAEKDRIVMFFFGGLYGAATSTSTATIQTFFMLMALNPEKQRAAQAEIDKVTEGQRLPTFADRERLPYVAALTKEVLRWHSVVPLGLPRQIRVPDEYNGRFIPANTIILPNIWAMGKAEGASSVLEEFSPERYLSDDKNTNDPHDFAFGFGRRICPGKFLADSALFSIFSSVLACFNITKKVDENREGGAATEIPIPIEFTRHLISYPKPFVCDIRPRSEQIVGLLENALSVSCDGVRHKDD